MQFFKYLFLLLLISPLVLNAQEGKDLSSGYHAYQKGVELFDKEKYAAAQQQFDKALEKMDNGERELMANARYYIAICAIELYNKDAEYLLNRFISTHPENPKVNSAYFHLGKFHYRQKNYQRVIQWFSNINRDKLTEKQLGEYYFKLGYSYYQLDKSTKASQAFYEIQEGNSTFSSPALYYYSHIAYQNGNYQTALEGFRQLTGNSTFAPIMPYYITQIYYFQERYEEVINYAPQFVQSATAKRLPEIARIIGDSYYQLRRYDSALTYLEMYRMKGEKMERQDHYRLGYVAYQLDSLDKAIKNFEQVTDQEDKIAQNAYYHLADCYLKQENKNNARLAFEFASKLDFDPKIKENALFNYGKLTYELRTTPFNEAIKAFKKYIDNYPDSDNTNEAYSYLVKAYLNTNNYKEALKSLEELEELELPLQKAYQKVAYYRGLELYNNRHYEDAAETFNLSLKYKDFDKQIAALSKYWQAESYYQLKNFEKAAASYNRFLLSPGAYNTEVYSRAHYNLGYTHFLLEDYSDAIKWFRKYINVTDAERNKYLADTYNRLGDSYFIRRNYEQAIDYYDNAIELDIRSQDYSYFQKGFAFGLQNRHEKKIATLKRLIENHSESGYIDDAYFEMGKSYMNLDQQQNAREYFNKIVTDYPSSNHVKESLVQLGLIHYNLNNNPRAISYYKRVVTEYPNTEQAKNALTGLRNIYVDMNKVDEYFSYVNSLDDYGRVSMNEQDSLTYMSAEKIYMNEGCENAVEFFREYLNKFTNGNFSVNAHFYMADCFDRQGKEDQALEHYRYVINQPRNSFTEQALRAAAQIYMDMENYREAIDQLSELEKIAEVKKNLIFSRVGQMRANYFLENYQEAYEAADKVLHTENINAREEWEAHFIKAKALFFEEKYDMALKEFRTVAEAVSNNEGAEARFRVAQIYYKKGKYKVAEDEIFEFVQQNSSNEYWKARSYILLADVYKATGDLFQARHTLKSIIENYEPSGKEDDILEIAREKHNEIIEKEKSQMEEDTTGTDTTREKIKIRLQENNVPDTSAETREGRETNQESPKKSNER
ncbi:MAG: tetratricopeptide repeat protein [Bacteroidales bacterium]|nr:tetratricopeptide repeat protein [Bacteroidales bacterium]